MHHDHNQPYCVGETILASKEKKSLSFYTQELLRNTSSLAIYSPFVHLFGQVLYFSLSLCRSFTVNLSFYSLLSCNYFNILCFYSKSFYFVLPFTYRVVNPFNFFNFSMSLLSFLSFIFHWVVPILWLCSSWENNSSDFFHIWQ